MAKTLLNGVNEVLAKVGVLDSAGELASIVDSSQQILIDAARQSLNEVIDELFSVAGLSKPNQLAERTITLKAGDRDYALHSSLVTLRTEFDLIDETNTHEIFLLDNDSGYLQIVKSDRELDDTGLPSFAALRPTDGQLFMDRAPTAAEADRVYKYRFDQELALSAATDKFPFKDPVFRAVVEAATEKWKFHRHREFSQNVFDKAVTRAARLYIQVPARTSYQPVSSHNATDPMESD